MRQKGSGPRFIPLKPFYKLNGKKMKLSDCKTFKISVPTRRHHTWASKMSTPIGHHAVVRLETDEGIVGWGESPAGETWGGSDMRYYGETPETVCHMIETHLFPEIKGMDPLHISNLHNRMDKVVKGNPYAKAAAVGSLINLLTLKPARKAALIIPERAFSSKYAGTVRTQSSIFCFK